MPSSLGLHPVAWIIHAAWVCTHDGLSLTHSSHSNGEPILIDMVRLDHESPPSSSCRGWVLDNLPSSKADSSDREQQHMAERMGRYARYRDHLLGHWNEMRRKTFLRSRPFLSLSSSAAVNPTLPFELNREDETHNHYVIIFCIHRMIR